MKEVISSLWQYRRHVLIEDALRKNKIRDFDPSIYDNLRNSIYTVLPSIIYIKYNRPTKPPGNCMERSYIISTAIPNSHVAYGDIPGTGRHYWVECDGVCYDPTSLSEYDKDVYYKIKSISNAGIISREELDGLGFIKFCREKTIEDVKKDPLLMDQLYATSTIIMHTKDYQEDPEYQEDLDSYLEKVGLFKQR